MISTQKPRHATDSSSLVIWRFLDGKPGHENQSRGLIRALGARHQIQEQRLKVGDHPHYLYNWLPWRLPHDRHLPAPDLIIGAGHATHYPMLRARRRRGGRVIALMRPSLPLRWFDLCILPTHDQREDDPPQVLATRGVLNAVTPSSHHQTQRGLILLGGPSRHYQWDEQRITDQVTRLLERKTANHWIIANSRRSPDGLLERLDQRLGQPSETKVEPVDWRQTDPDWLPDQLAQASQIWVSEDSVSMVYEALTASGRVGLLTLVPDQPDRVVRGLQQLRADGFAYTLDDPAETPNGIASAFNEAERCAQWIEQHWLNPA